MEQTLVSLQHGGDVLFLLLGAVMVFAMHAGFAFLEVGTVRRKNQVNAFVKILSDWSVSTVVYFAVGYPISYGVHFFGSSALGGLGGVSFPAQLAGSLAAVTYALVSGYIIYQLIDKISGFRLNEDQEFRGADLTVHQIDAYPEENVK